ncbi:hypothetical protein QFZ43_007945 [Streptomyces afghaniensis]|nr:hypothetical protein [Streptomyces afghaniensis]
MLRLTADGIPTREIAERLCLSVATVRNNSGSTNRCPRTSLRTPWTSRSGGAGHVGPARHGTCHHVTVAVVLGDDLDVVLAGQRRGEGSPHQAGVLDEKNADHCRSHSAGAAR